jgi:uncharacterized coiled-coil protein SlyX
VTNERDELEARLEQLENEERSLSARRRKLHDRMAIFPASEELAEQERALSKLRRELHQQIDELRERRSASGKSDEQQPPH